MSKINRLLLVSVTIVILFSVLYYALFYFFNKKNESVALLLSKVDTSISDNVELRNLKNIIKEVDGDGGKLDSYFLTKTKIVQFLETLESLGDYTNTNVEVRTINEVDDIKLGSFNHLDLNISASGSFQNVYHFLSAIENLPYEVDVKEVRFERKSINSDIENEWNIIINFTVVQVKDN